MSVRILHVLATPRAEGTPNLVLDWLSAGSGHFQAVTVLNSQPADLTDRLRDADAYEEHDLFPRNKLSKFPGIARAAFRAVKRVRPDVVVCWPTGFANWICLGARLAGAKKLLVHCGNPPNRGFRADWITRYVMWPLALLGAKCICCSDYVRREYRSVPLVPKRLFHVVWNCSRGAAIAAAAERGRGMRNGEATFRAIMVATLEAHKDHKTLIQAVPSLAARLPQFELWLAGEGSLRSMIEQEIAMQKVGDRVRLLGRRSDIGELLGQSDVFVLSTTPQEGLGSVLIEAMAAGLPIVATDVPACREILDEGRHGRLVPSQSPDILAAALEEALVCCSNKSGKTKNLALELTPEKMMSDYLRIASGGR